MPKLIPCFSRGGALSEGDPKNHNKSNTTNRMDKTVRNSEKLHLQLASIFKKNDKTK